MLYVYKVHSIHLSVCACICVHKSACILTVAFTYIIIILCVQVKFIGEEAVDQGGPKREYWRLLAIDIVTKLCIGSDDRLTLEHDVLGL